MKKIELWNAFLQSGRVEDYLRYCGVSSVTPASGEGDSANDIDARKERHHGDRDGRIDHQGKPSFR